MAELSEAQKQNLSAVDEHQRSLGRRLYVGQSDTAAKSLNSLVKLGFLDTEDANDGAKTYGLTEEGAAELLHSR